MANLLFTVYFVSLQGVCLLILVMLRDVAEITSLMENPPKQPEMSTDFRVPNT